MTTNPALVAAAAAALLTSRRLTAAAAATDLPNTPGLYAVFAELDAQEQLGLPVCVGELPIYVGKSETSLLKRDGETHFKLGQTGQSILRRSIAALLHDALGLCGQPRNPSDPGYFDKFGLAPQHDEALQRWIGEHLTISTWLKPSDAGDQAGDFLLEIERALLKLWTPPLNERDNPGRWRELRKIRRIMAEEARAWRPARS